ncbi:protein neprosin-like [Silene latifolia]|uniref:protein neprosin-like n=1 Tax=Silene latifolia TaxID=37657 RepID=UPI003D76CE25
MAIEITFVVILCSLVFNLISVESFPEKQPRISITTDNGQKYNCVSFYKQPAFGDPSLNLEVVPNLVKLQQQRNASEIGFKTRKCPIGTVPILDRSKQHVEDVPPVHPYPPPSPEQHCSARVQTRANDPNKKFFGAGAAIVIYKPVVQASQWSSARIKISNGGESIEAGWMVNPQEFKDMETHFYASFRAGGKGCINTDCAGFVQVAPDFPLGIIPHAYSTKKQQLAWSISIDKHQDDGHWWLSVKGSVVGYWPKNLFTTLKDVANQVEFGGEINDPGAISPAPWMGNGSKAVYNTQDSSCFRRSTVVDASFQHVNPPDTEKFADCEALYSVLDGGYQNNPDLGRLIFYGGPFNG